MVFINLPKPVINSHQVLSDVVADPCNEPDSIFITDDCISEVTVELGQEFLRRNQNLVGLVKTKDFAEIMKYRKTL